MGNWEARPVVEAVETSSSSALQLPELPVEVLLLLILFPLIPILLLISLLSNVHVYWKSRIYVPECSLLPPSPICLLLPSPFRPLVSSSSTHSKISF